MVGLTLHLNGMRVIRGFVKELRAAEGRGVVLPTGEIVFALMYQTVLLSTANSQYLL